MANTGDIERWITMNGVHIPIMKGESRTKAVANFIKSKRYDKKKDIVKRYVDRNAAIDRKSGSSLDKEAEYDASAAQFHKESNALKRTIKGRARTKEGIINSLDKDEMIDLKNKKIVGPQPSYTKVTKGNFKGYYRNVYNNNDPYIDKDMLMREMKNYDSNQIRNRKTGETKPIKTYEGRYRLKATNTLQTGELLRNTYQTRDGKRVKITNSTKGPTLKIYDKHGELYESATYPNANALLKDMNDMGIKQKRRK